MRPRTGKLPKVKTVPMVTTAVRLPPDLYRRLHEAAFADGQPPADWMRVELARAALRAEKRRARLGGARASVAA